MMDQQSFEKVSRLFRYIAFTDGPIPLTIDAELRKKMAAAIADTDFPPFADTHNKHWPTALWIQIEEALTSVLDHHTSSLTKNDTSQAHVDSAIAQLMESLGPWESMLNQEITLAYGFRIGKEIALKLVAAKSVVDRVPLHVYGMFIIHVFHLLNGDWNTAIKVIGTPKDNEGETGVAIAENSTGGNTREGQNEDNAMDVPHQFSNYDMYGPVGSELYRRMSAAGISRIGTVLYRKDSLGDLTFSGSCVAPLLHAVILDHANALVLHEGLNATGEDKFREVESHTQWYIDQLHKAAVCSREELPEGLRRFPLNDMQRYKFFGGMSKIIFSLAQGPYPHLSSPWDDITETEAGDVNVGVSGTENGLEDTDSDETQECDGDDDESNEDGVNNHD